MCKKRWQTYGVALGCWLAVLGVRLALARLGYAILYPHLMFTLVIVISAWYGGLGPGLLATVLTTTSVIYFFVEPLHGWSILKSQDLVPTGLYIAQGVLISLLGHANKISQDRLNQSRRELAQKVDERTAELLESNHQLQILNGRLECSNRELQDFAFVASHDLQEPLRKIITFGDCLDKEYRGTLGTAGQKYLQRMQSAARRMQDLIQDLLLLSRLSTHAAQFRSVDLSAVAGEVLGDLELRIDASGSRVEVSPLPTIEADPTQMRQLLQNLIENALKFQRPDVPGSVRVYAERNGSPPSEVGPPGRPTVRLCVADNGIGFDEKHLDRIFTVFQRLNGHDRYEGTGIGLSICRRIVERHGGSITARSRPHAGATFIVTLPRKQQDEDPVHGT